ncbi:hypothetical protein [Bartonella sp. HY406]|uniref:hypothetical protein n=1 Tax=Bartonella sp. HY406 TaxID=2979331 RepID=UPI0021C63A13|nr:hypothetical protein [Bartonella sp. HY406]UXN02614.1 hypothetical protein N6B01_09020 [Bartonella sp. HY406]
MMKIKIFLKNKRQLAQLSLLNMMGQALKHLNRMKREIPANGNMIMLAISSILPMLKGVGRIMLGIILDRPMWWLMVKGILGNMIMMVQAMSLALLMLKGMKRE